MRKLALFVIAISVSAFGATAAFACSDQKGKVIFADDFSDDSGGWEADASVTVGKGVAKIQAGGKISSAGVLNVTFNATAADYCAEFVFPSSPEDPANSDDAGLYFLCSDYSNKFSFNIDAEGEFWIVRTSNGKSSFLTNATKTPEVKKDAGATNQVRVVVKDQKATFFINGAQVKVLRLPALDATANRFGFWSGANSAPPANPREYDVKSFQVSEAQ